MPQPDNFDSRESRSTGAQRAGDQSPRSNGATAQSPRTLVKKTLEYDSPARVPRHLWTLPWAEVNHPGAIEKIQREFPDDIVSSPGFFEKEPRTEGDAYKPGTFIDEWGCVFENKNDGAIGEVKDPVINDWSDVEKVRLPEERLTINRDKVNEFCSNTDRFVIAGKFPRPFERLQFLRRTENLYMDLIEEPSELHEMIRRMHDFYMKEIELWARTDVDALMIMDDWGAQSALLINPETWRKIFKPLYADYIAVGRKYNKYMFMHSDGHTLAIIPELIDMGLNAINAQIFCIGVENLRKFRGKLTFWGEIDRQHLLPYGSIEDIRGAVKSVKENLYAEGGTIAQCEFGPGAKPENVYEVFKTWSEIV